MRCHVVSCCSLYALLQGGSLLSPTVKLDAMSYRAAWMHGCAVKPVCAGVQGAYHRADQLPRVGHLQPEPGGRVSEAPVWQQLFVDEAHVALSVGDPHRHHSAPLYRHDQHHGLPGARLCMEALKQSVGCQA